MTPRTLKLNAHRTLTYYTPEDVERLLRDLDHARRCHGEARVALNVVTETARQNAELLTGYWKAAEAEASRLRALLQESGLIEIEQDDDP